jgi:hypothetical protein
MQRTACAACAALRCVALRRGAMQAMRHKTCSIHRRSLAVQRDAGNAAPKQHRSRPGIHPSDFRWRWQLLSASVDPRQSRLDRCRADQERRVARPTQWEEQAQEAVSFSGDTTIVAR